MRNEDSFDRLIAASERELRDLKTISARPFGLIKFYTKTITTNTVHGFQLDATLDSDAILPAMLTISQGTSDGAIPQRKFRAIDTQAGTYTYQVASESSTTARKYIITINSSSAFTTELRETP